MSENEADTRPTSQTIMERVTTMKDRGYDSHLRPGNAKPTSASSVE